MRDLTLAPNPGKNLSKKKLKSLSKKYFSIPAAFINYYDYPKYSKKDSDDTNPIPIIPKKKKRKGVKSVGSKKKRRVGRPKKLPVPITGVKSLTNYFRVM